MLRLYSYIMGKSEFFLRSLLKKRLRQGKEDPERLNERMGQYERPRPQMSHDGRLIWFHAASVGEAQSTMILVHSLLESYKDIHILVTTGTVTSAALMAERLPARAFHQYYPLDHPKWVESFLDHWQPDAALWMESEIWPNMISAIKARNIPAAIINARLSERSVKRWSKTPKDIQALLSAFSVCIAQTQDDADSFKNLGMKHVLVSGNLKYSAAPLPVDTHDYEALKNALGARPVWLLASTHSPEEDIACRIHNHLEKTYPDLLTIIVPRHPERRDNIMNGCEKFGFKSSAILRGGNKYLPDQNTKIYIADTIGELGLFYKLSPIAFIGRSLSNDGGGGHNPIEAAQHSCAILHGPLIQNLQAIYNDFDQYGATIKVKDEMQFQRRLEKLLGDSDGLHAMQNKAHDVVKDKSEALPLILETLTPLIDNKKTENKKCA